MSGPSPSYTRRLSNFVDYGLSGTAYFWGKLFGGTMVANSLTPLESQCPLSPLVYRALGENPGPFTLQGTNTYLVGQGSEKILIDTGEPNISKYIDTLKLALANLGKHQSNCHISRIICTHWHGDHVGGIKQVIERVIGREVPVHKFRRSDAPDDLEHASKSGYEYLTDGQTFLTEGTTLRVVYTPGHTTDHIGLYLEEENVLFSGDCVLGEGTSVFEDLHTYMNSLEKLLNLKPAKIYPGHGPVIENPVEKIQEYIDHRNLREKQIVDFLRSQSPDYSSVMDIVNGVYKGIPFSVKLGAANNVQHHLSKLLKDGKVKKSNSGTWAIEPDGTTDSQSGSSNHL